MAEQGQTDNGVWSDLHMEAVTISWHLPVHPSNRCPTPRLL